MTRPFALLLLAFNIIAISIAIVVPLILHQGHRIADSDALERRLSARLSSIATPAEMQSRSTELAHLMGSSNRAVHRCVQLLDTSFQFFLFLSGVNIAFLLISMWKAPKIAATPPV
jgi:hypothetical protein